MAYLEPFYALIGERIVPELLKLDAESAGTRHWSASPSAQGVCVRVGACDEQCVSGRCEFVTAIPISVDGYGVGDDVSWTVM